MVRSACLPDAETLGALLRGLRAPPVPPPASQRAADAARRTEPPPRANEVDAEPTTSRPAAQPEVDEDVLVRELTQELRGTGGLEQGFQRLATWLEVRTLARATFVADAEGLGMTRSPAYEPYLAAAGEIGVVLDKLATILPDVNGSTTLELDGAKSLVLIGCKTGFGRYSVGLVTERPLERFWPSVIRKAVGLMAPRAASELGEESTG